MRSGPALIAIVAWAGASMAPGGELTGMPEIDAILNARCLWHYTDLMSAAYATEAPSRTILTNLRDPNIAGDGSPPSEILCPPIPIDDANAKVCLDVSPDQGLCTGQGHDMELVIILHAARLGEWPS